jgi:membrane protein DedA with SNARE-associated domain
MIKLKSILIEVMKKKSVNENLALGILATLSGILIGKIALYYIGQLVEKGIKYQ